MSRDWGTSRSSALNPPGLRLAIVLGFAAVVVLASIVAASLLLWRATELSRTLRQQTIDAALTLSHALDQEVAAMNFLLKGLATSPALQSGDFKTFYDQLMATAVPEGSWLILNDLEGQVLNTLRPFGTALPRHADFPTSPVERVRETGWSVSGRTTSLLRPGVSLVGLGLKVDTPRQPSTHFLVVVVSEFRLTKLMSDLKFPLAVHVGAFDRGAQPLSAPASNGLVLDQRIRGVLSERLAGLRRGQALDEVVEANDEKDSPVLIALRRSALTDWTTMAVMPAAVVNAPFREAVFYIGGTSIVLALMAGIVAYLMSRRVEGPLAALALTATAAKQEIDELSQRLLVLQEEERRRIARELHDSTTQHLVAGTLGLMQIQALAGHDQSILRTCADVKASLDKALRELRIFTYLLHPPSLESEGLKATLISFVEGYCRRTGLDTDVRIADDVDHLSFDLQRSILRVVQEAIGNVQRHAKASKVTLVLKMSAKRLIVCIRDDGRGISDLAATGQPTRLGVGILGMRARLLQVGGELRIKTSASGTAVVALVPLTARGRDGELPTKPVGSQLGPIPFMSARA